MDLEIITLNDMSERQLPNGITYMWNLKYDTEKQPHRHGKETYGQQRGKQGRDKLGGWDSCITLIHTKQITNKDLLMAQGTVLNILQ